MKPKIQPDYEKALRREKSLVLLGRLAPWIAFLVSLGLSGVGLTLHGHIWAKLFLYGLMSVCYYFLLGPPQEIMIWRRRRRQLDGLCRKLSRLDGHYPENRIEIAGRCRATRDLIYDRDMPRDDLTQAYSVAYENLRIVLVNAHHGYPLPAQTPVTLAEAELPLRASAVGLDSQQLPIILCGDEDTINNPFTLTSTT